MYPSAFDREREMPPSPTNLQTDKVCRHFTIAWCKCHNHRRIYRWIKSIGISQRVVEMPHSPTNLQRDTVRRYFTGCWKIFTGYATITDEINPSVYFQLEFFFLRTISVCKTSGNIFFVTDRLSHRMRYVLPTNSMLMDVFRRRFSWWYFHNWKLLYLDEPYHK
jgi:hypothetical protein